MDKTTKRTIALFMIIAVAIVAATGNIIWLNFWTALSATLIATAIGLLYKSIGPEKKRDGYNPQPTIPSQPLQDQLLQNNTTIINNINSPNSVTNVTNSEENKTEENSEDEPSNND